MHFQKAHFLSLLVGIIAYPNITLGNCVTSGGGNYTCSGVATTLQDIQSTPANVTTAPGFSAQRGVNIVSASGITFVDLHQSTISGTTEGGLNTLSVGNLFGTPSDVNIASNGNFYSSQNYAVRLGTGLAFPVIGTLNATFTGSIVSESPYAGLMFAPLSNGGVVNVNHVTGGNGVVAWWGFYTGVTRVGADMTLNINGSVRGAGSGLNGESDDLARRSGVGALVQISQPNIRVGSNANFNINVARTGSVEGTLAGVYATTYDGPTSATTTVNTTNDGVIRNTSNLTTAMAIGASNARMNVINNGTIIGTINYTGSPTGPTLLGLDDVLRNRGRWLTGGGLNDFGSGNDSVINSGIVSAAGPGSLPVLTRFDNLELFTNGFGGIVTAQNNVAGDRVVLTGGSGAGNWLSGGGQLRLDTFLGDDASPSDRLVVGGNTTTSPGQAVGIFVNNVGGPGALTKGDGIRVVEVAGSSAPAAFTLGSANATLPSGQRAQVAGAFAYTLHQNGVANSDGGWYLRSTWQPMAPLYAGLSGSLLAGNARGFGSDRYLGRVGKSSSNEQVCYPDGTPANRCATDWFDAVFAGRMAPIWVQYETMGFSDKVAGSSLALRETGRINQLRGGYDTAVEVNSSNMIVIGGNWELSERATRIKNDFGIGKIATSSVGAGISATWLNVSGYYIDVAASIARLDHRLSSDTLQASAPGALGHVLSASVEAGKKTAVSEKLALTPVAAVAFDSARVAGFTGPFGEQVRQVQAQRSQLKFGFRADYTDCFGDDQSPLALNVAAYLTKNLHYNASAQVSGMKLSSGSDDLGAAASAKVSYALTKIMTVNASVAAQTSLTGAFRQYSGQLGLAARF